MVYAEARARPAVAEFDQALIWTMALLMALGLVMVYSASIAIAEGSRATGHQPGYFLARHGLYAAAGLAAAAVAFQLPMRLWQGGALWLFLLGAALLVLVLVPGVGREV